jgi:hypothetical protein
MMLAFDHRLAHMRIGLLRLRSLLAQFYLMLLLRSEMQIGHYEHGDSVGALKM